jgi:hypothetical protein
MAQRSLRDSPRTQPDLNGTDHTVHPRTGWSRSGILGKASAPRQLLLHCSNTVHPWTYAHDLHPCRQLLPVRATALHQRFFASGETAPAPLPARATALRQRFFGLAEFAPAPLPARATALRQRFFGLAEIAPAPLPALLYLPHPCSRARSSLIRLPTRRFEIAKRSTNDCVSHWVVTPQLVSSMEWVVFTSHLFAERGVPPGAIFREKIECRWYTMYLRRGPDQAGS